MRVRRRAGRQRGELGRFGKLNAQMAFMSGKLKIQGDMGLAMKLQQIL